MLYLIILATVCLFFLNVYFIYCNICIIQNHEEKKPITSLARRTMWKILFIKIIKVKDRSFQKCNLKRYRYVRYKHASSSLKIENNGHR